MNTDRMDGRKTPNYIKVAGALFVASLGVSTVWLALNSEQRKNQNIGYAPLSNPTGVVPPTEETTASVRQVQNENPIPTTITNGMTGRNYELTADPMGLGRQCAKRGEYPNTLVGLTVALGPRNDMYIDTSGVIYSNDKNGRWVQIGTFNRSHLPTYCEIPLANSDSIACANNQ
jgi:hypothetical protein